MPFECESHEFIPHSAARMHAHVSCAALVHPSPFSIQADGKTVDLNPHSWNQFASIIYLESPSGVGYSYGTDNNYTAGDASTAKDNFDFLQGFFAEYNEFSTQRFFVAGER